MTKPTLYLVATPIGNLSDITLRAIEVLKSVDWIAAEDTRHSQRLLSHYEIFTPCFSLHEHNEDDRIKKILALLEERQSVAVISDAGTPLISDPGFRLVRAVREAGFSVSPVPGACAIIAALTTSGLPTDRFIFEGFLPVKTHAMELTLEKIKQESRTVIFYESTHRIAKTIPLMQRTLGDNRVVSIVRELTKAFETIKTDTLQHLSEWIKAADQQKGEFVIVVQGVPMATPCKAKLAALLKILLSELSVKQAVNLACKITGERKNVMYELALALQD